MAWGLALAAIALTLAAYFCGPLGRTRALADPDAYQWLVQVEAWDAGRVFTHWHAFDESPRGNAPWGERLHWTKPFGLLLLVPAKLLATCTGMEFKSVLWMWAIVVSPLLLAAAALVAMRTWRQILSVGAQFAAAILFLTAPGILAVGAGGRPDHHALQFLIFILAQYFVLRAVTVPAFLCASAAWAGVMTGFGLWVGVETGALALIVSGFFFLLWMWRGGEWIEALEAFWISVAAVVIAGLLIERAPGQWGVRAVDSLSMTTAGICALAAVLVWGMRAAAERMTLRARGRIVMVAAVALGGAGAVLRFFPEAWAGPMAAIDARAVELWMRSVGEAAPLVADWRASWPLVVAFLGMPMAGLVVLFFGIRRGRKEAGWELSAEARGWLWMLLAVGMYVALTLVAGIRWAVYAQAAAIPVCAWGIALVVRNLSRMKLLVMTALALLPALIGLVANQAARVTFPAVSDSSARVASSQPAAFTQTQFRCELPLAELGRWLDEYAAARPGRPLTVLAFVNHGPELLYRSRISVVGTPYHRNGAAIADEWDFFADASSNADRAHAIAKARGVDLVLICPGYAEERAYYKRASEGSLYARLCRGDVPGWLAPMDLPAELAGHFLIFKIKQID